MGRAPITHSIAGSPPGDPCTRIGELPFHEQEALSPRHGAINRAACPETRRGRYMTMQAKQGMGALLAVLLVGAPAAAFGQANCRNTGAFEPLARRLQEGSGGPRHFPSHDRGRGALPGARPAHHQYRPRAAVLRAELPGNLRQDAGRRAAPERRRPDQEAPGPVRTRGKGIRRARFRDHRLLGPRERFRQPVRARTRRSSRWRRSPTTAAARTCSAGICSTRCA